MGASIGTYRFFQILQNAMASLIKHDHAPTILLKSFLFSREEGLPVKNLVFSDYQGIQRKLRAVLGKPVKDSVELSEQVPPLLESLCKWLRTETELRC